MMIRKTSLSLCIALLFAAWTPAIVLAETAPAAASKADAGQKSDAKSDAVDAPTRIERTLLDITETESQLFHSMETGELKQEDFERRAIALSYRYDELISRDPNNVEVLILYGKYLRRLGQNRQANVFFAHADRLSPNLAVVKQQLGNYLAEEGNYPEALTYYMKAVELEPNEAVYHYGIGELLATFRDKFVADGAFTEDAIDTQTLAAFAKAVELAPGDKDFAFRHAEAYYDIRTPRWEAALALWNGISERKDLTTYERDAARLHRARINCELGRSKDALALVRDEVDPVLMATRTRLLKRINSMTTPAEDKSNAAIMAPTPVPAGVPEKSAPVEAK